VTLPRWTYATEGAQASLTLALDATRPHDERLVLAELEALVGAIETARRTPAPTPRVLRADHHDPQRWARAIAAIQGAIEGGGARKIVAARRSVVTTERDLEPLDVLARLALAHPGEARGHTTRFLVRSGSASFVGATPEHLFVKRGARITTEALAGSIAADAERGAERLLASPKDRDEHAYVVRHIVERLGPLCARIAHADAPQVRRLPTVLHLRTPIEAELASPTHPLEIAAALHPTPAVGGTPVEHAVPWIVRHETERGWYGAPLGWVDAAGDGELVVALRCGVVQGGRAWLWAGGGIVAGSDPALEWEETALKMRPMLRALGACP
jgi:isochorismate synthase